MGPPDPGAVEVCVDLEAATAATAVGTDVVLVLPEGAQIGARPGGPGRLAVLVGDPSDPGSRVAASAMGTEVFGP